MPTKSLFEQEAPEIGTQKCSTKQGVREPLHVEFALNNRELVIRGKSVRANGPIKMKKMKGAFFLNNLLVGTVRPPDQVCFCIAKALGPMLY